MMKNIFLLLLISCLVQVRAQVYYSQDFENTANPSWTIYDLNNNGTSWYNYTQGSTDTGQNSLVSDSFDEDNVDNLVVVGPIDLSSADANNLKLVFNTFADNQEGGAFAEHYAVYVANSSDANELIATTPVFEETLSTGDLTLKTVDFSAYAGQSGLYLAFRHFNTTDQFYLGLDNVKVITFTENDVTLNALTLKSIGLLNQSTPLKIGVTNSGANDVTSLTINWNNGTDHVYTFNETISPSSTVVLEHPEIITGNELGEQIINVTITQVNGTTDANPSDNTATASYATLSQSANKKVYVEEGTGAWCGHCPRGIVEMRNAYQQYPNEFVGVAVHSNDVMAVNEIEEGFEVGGLPAMKTDRIINEDIGLGSIGYQISERNGLPSPANIGCDITVNGNIISFVGKASFVGDFTHANFRLIPIIMEDEVTGTGESYAQTNYYSGSGEVMGGFENLPNPVPAEQMVYNHVARAVPTGYWGIDETIPQTITQGVETEYTFTYEVPEGQDINHLKIILLLSDAATGEVYNSDYFPVQNLSVIDNTISQDQMQVFPNPVNESLTVSFNGNGKTLLNVYSMTGNLLYSKDLGNVQGKIESKFNVSRFKSGSYILTIQGEKAAHSKIFIVK